MTSRFMSRTVLALALLWTLGTAAPAAAAQKLARSYTEVPAEGFKFKPLDFDAVPIDYGKGGDEVVKFGDDQDLVTVYAFHSEDEETKGKGKGESVAKKKRKSIVGYLQGSLVGFSKKLAKAPTVEEEVEINGINATHRRFEWTLGSGVNKEPIFVDIWSFPLAHADVHIVYRLLDDADKKLLKVIEKSAKSFEEIERVVLDEIDVGERSFAEQLAWAEAEAARTPGWQAIGTPSERFIILTSSDKRAFVKEVIERLEVSRDVYEEDFPPPAGFNAVSVVRICKDADEFHEFSNTPRGVAGYFSPSTVELVLYDNVSTNRNSTYAVVSHEAFHQYCHFLFNESEAHRWFDEGHGDYYGGMKISGKRGRITPKMPAGLDRLSVIDQMVREETYKPLSEHLYYDHQQWQGQGPSNVSGYAQSWSIIYMLRQGSLRKVPRKVWKDEYAEIIPNYVRVLNEGYLAAYEEIREERIKKAKKKGKKLEPKRLKITRRDLDPREKKKIWKAAMEASWGKIDLDEFEANWVLYIQKYLK